MKLHAPQLALCAWIGIAASLLAQSSHEQPPGLLYFASYPERDNPAPAANPHLTGALFTIYWSDVEKIEGQFDWSGLDRRIAVWKRAGKRVALRIMWSSSGNWPEPAAKHPTPQFVLDAGAVTVRSDSSKTDIPLFWDPVYRKYATRFLAEVARKFDGDPTVLFIDVTPGAETNPYRFRRINVNEPEFKTRFLATAASDGRKYSHELWLNTVKQAIDEADAAFNKTPLLVTLNVGSLDGPEQSQIIGDHAVSRGCLVGQNGLNARSYNAPSARKTAFDAWSTRTRFYFEMVDASGGNTGSLMDVMKAAERVGCDYLGVYAADVLRGTKGQPAYDAESEAALAYGAKVMGKPNTRAATAAPAAPAQNRRAGGPLGARNREPSWLMPPVEGANLHYKTFDSKIAGGKVSYLLYLPPGYESEKERRHPVVYWLHGIGGSQQGVPGLAARVTGAIEAGKTPPFIMVFVNGMIDSFYCDAADPARPVESVIIKELIPHVDATLRTIATRAGRMIEGFSMGGYGAAHLGFKYPDLFGSVSIIDGAVIDLGTMKSRHATLFQSIFGGKDEIFSAAHPRTLAEKNTAQIKSSTHIRQIVGALAAPNEALHAQMSQLGIAHDFEIFADAGHNMPTLYERLGDKNWTFYRNAFAQISTPKSGATSPRPKARTGTQPAAAPPPSAAPLAPKASATPQGFHLNGERWTHREGNLDMSGILLKPEGKGPFPAVLISHGLGGTAENFGLSKAREMVKWNLVCIAPNYTHSAAMMGGRPKQGSGRGQTPANAGASEENIRRAKVCLDILRELPVVDAKHIGAYGHSMGGFVTIGLAAALPELKAAAITGSGVAPREGFPAPSSARAGTIRTPFLIMHGGSDPVVRPEQSAMLKAVLDGNNVPNDRRVFEGEGHPIDQTRRDEVLGAIREWFTRHGILKP